MSTRPVDFSLGQGDTDVLWAVPVFDPSGNPVDLTQPDTSVALHYRIDDASAPAVDVVGTVVGAQVPAEAGYNFQGSDTAAPGVFAANFLITLPGGERLTYPPDRHLYFEVLEQV